MAARTNLSWTATCYLVSVLARRERSSQMINRSDWCSVHEQIAFADGRSSLGSRHDRPIRGDDYGVIACEISHLPNLQVIIVVVTDHVVLT